MAIFQAERNQNVVGLDSISQESAMHYAIFDTSRTHFVYAVFHLPRLLNNYEYTTLNNLEIPNSYPVLNDPPTPNDSSLLDVGYV